MTGDNNPHTSTGLLKWICCRGNSLSLIAPGLFKSATSQSAGWRRCQTVKSNVAAPHPEAALTSSCLSTPAQQFWFLSFFSGLFVKSCNWKSSVPTSIRQETSASFIGKVKRWGGLSPHLDMISYEKQDKAAAATASYIFFCHWSTLMQIIYQDEQLSHFY